MTTVRNVAIAGPTGNLGPAVLKAIVDAGFTVTVLTRPDSNRQFPEGVKTAEVDFESSDSIAQALKGQDAFVSTIGNQPSHQLSNMIDGAIAAGVSRYIPSEFGTDTTLPSNQGLPTHAPKFAHQKEVTQKVARTKTTYTFLMNGPFLDWGLDTGFLADIKNRKIVMWDGGDVPFSATTLPKVGEAVVAILRHPEETANKVIRVHGMVLTLRKIFEVAQRVLGQDRWETPVSSTAEAESKSVEALKKDPANVPAWLLGFLYRAIFSKECEPEFKHVDNDLLGLKMDTEADLETFLRHASG